VSAREHYFDGMVYIKETYLMTHQHFNDTTLTYFLLTAEHYQHHALASFVRRIVGVHFESAVCYISRYVPDVLYISCGPGLIVYVSHFFGDEGSTARLRAQFRNAEAR
jgi:hypothetical protein